MPEDRKRFDLGNYVEVKDRIAKFYELFGQGRLVTGEVRLTNEPDGVPRVMVQGLAYRSPEDLHPGVGWSWMELPGKTTYTKGSELENTETSAWGRAIGSLGILIDQSIASGNEVRNKEGDAPSHPNGIVSTKDHPVDLTRTPEGGLIGTAVTKDRYDMNLRETPDGWVWPFRIKNGSTSFGVVAENALAQALDAIKSTVIDQRVTVWGRWSDEVTPAKGTRPEVKWRLLHLERIATPDGILPAPAWDSDGPVPEPKEALPEPLFDDEEQARIDAALAESA